MEKKTKQNHKILKRVLFIFGVSLVLLAIHLIRNYIIISDIADKQAVLKQCTNYSYVTEHYTEKDENDKTIIEHYYKDGKSMLVIKRDTKINLVWYDKATQETIYLSPNELKATIVDSPFVLGNEIPIFAEETPVSNTMYLTLISFISNDQIQGQQCYKINWGGAKVYINKENGTLLKSMNGKAIIEEKEYQDITEFKNWNLENLKEEDVARPNLTGYEVIYNK